jgi:hypothetical protein
LNGIQEVTGSNPVWSTNSTAGCHLVSLLTYASMHVAAASARLKRRATS